MNLPFIICCWLLNLIFAFIDGGFCDQFKINIWCLDWLILGHNYEYRNGIWVYPHGHILYDTSFLIEPILCTLGSIWIKTSRFKKNNVLPNVFHDFVISVYISNWTLHICWFLHLVPGPLILVLLCTFLFVYKYICICILICISLCIFVGFCTWSPAR